MVIGFWGSPESDPIVINKKYIYHVPNTVGAQRGGFPPPKHCKGWDPFGVLRLVGSGLGSRSIETLYAHTRLVTVFIF